MLETEVSTAFCTEEKDSCKVEVVVTCLRESVVLEYTLNTLTRSHSFCSVLQVQPATLWRWKHLQKG